MFGFKTLSYFMFFFKLASFYLSFTHKPQCSKILNLKARESFGDHYVSVLFNVTRAPGSFLVISALKTDDQPWTFK